MNSKFFFLIFFLLLQNYGFGQTGNDIELSQDSSAFEEKIFAVVEDMPRFPWCEGKGLSKDELKTCAESEMLKFIYSKLKYPERAKKNKTEGKVIVEITIGRDCWMEKVELLEDIGDGCGEEAVRVVHLMNGVVGKWGGKSRGQPSRLSMKLPISFKL